MRCVQMSSGLSTSPAMAAANASGPCVVNTYSRLSGSSPPRKLRCASGPSPGALRRPCCERCDACTAARVNTSTPVLLQGTCQVLRQRTPRQDDARTVEESAGRAAYVEESGNLHEVRAAVCQRKVKDAGLVQFGQRGLVVFQGFMQQGGCSSHQCGLSSQRHLHSDRQGASVFLTAPCLAVRTRCGMRMFCVGVLQERLED